MGRLFFSAMSLAIVGTLSPAWAENADRIALVIGNSSYEHVDSLPNPEKDAGLIAETLHALGFTLINGRAQVNLKEDEFRQAVKAFGEAAQHAQIALFYYAGHGVEQQNEENKSKNYLVPVDVPKNATVDSLIDIEFIVRQIQRAAGLKVIVLDACRNNPFAEEGRSLRLARGQDSEPDRFRDLGAPKGGLAEMKIPPGTLMAFSTQPGEIAEDGRDGHSPYSKALAETMKQRGLTVWQVLNRTARKVEEESSRRKRPQVPWLSSSSIDDTVAFISGSGGAIAVATAGEELPVVTSHPANPATNSAAEIARKYEAHMAALEQGSQAQGATALATPVGPLSSERERALKPSDHFKECDNCPEMVTLPPGTFLMGSPTSESGHQANEGPQQQIEFVGAFAVGRLAVTFDEWNACVADGGCNGYRPADYGWGGGKHPVINVSWNDAQAYVAWLSKKTGAPYRLLSEAEREYATRACTSTDCPSTPFWFGAEISPDRANYDWRRSYNGSAKAQAALRTVASDASEPNPFGLLQVHGNVREWVADCWNPSLSGQPPDGTARMKGDCSSHVLRGGSWKDEPRDLRSAKRTWELADERQPEIGFRVARTLRK